MQEPPTPESPQATPPPPATTGISLYTKLIGSMLLLLSVMMAAVVFSYIKNEQADARLTLLSDSLVPITSNVANVAVYALQQQTVFDRIIRHWEEGGSDKASLDSDEQRFLAFRGKVEQELAMALALIKTELTNDAVSRDEAVELAQIATTLEKLAKRQQDFQDHAVELLASKDELSAELLLSYNKKIEEESTTLSGELENVLLRMEGFVDQEAKIVVIGELEAHHFALLVAALTFVAGLVLSPLFTRTIIKPIRKLTSGVQNVADGDLDIQIPVTSKDEIGALSEAFNSMVGELRTKALIKSMFGKYVDPRIVESLISSDDAPEILSNQKKEMTIFFSDVESFSSISESLTADGLVKFINHYFSVVSDPIHLHHGVIDKYIGDAVMAFWGPPFSKEDQHATLACEATLAQFESLEYLNASIGEVLGLKKGVPEVNIRVGLCTGEVVAGNIGSKGTTSYTVMGDTVNIAARLESANKQFGTRILMNQTTYMQVRDRFEARKVDKIVVVGMTEPVEIYELLGRKGQVSEAVIDAIELYGKALELYETRAWDRARSLLEQCLAIRADDGPSRVLLDRIAYIHENPPPENWDGVWRMTKK